MAYTWVPPAPEIPFVTDHRYSSLHQEHSYLLSALAKEESRLAHLSRTRESVRAKLVIAEAHGSSAEEVGRLKKAVAAISRKLKQCHKSERAMADNLSAVSERIRMLELHQWQKASFEYSQKMYQTPTHGMVLGFPEMTLELPISPACMYGWTVYSPMSCTMPSVNIALSSMPGSPLLQSQSMVNVGNAWNTPLPVHYDHFQIPLGPARLSMPHKPA